MKVLQTLVDRLKRRREKKAVRETLSEQDVENLRSLLKDDRFITYAKAVDLFAEIEAEKCLTNPTKLGWVYIKGLRDSVLLVDNLISGEDLNEQQRERRERIAERGRDTSALYGTSGWTDKA